MVSKHVRNLQGSSSLFLDILRLLCSLIVLLAHSHAIWFPEKENNLLLSHLSHGGVVVFFVLSGFVIAYTTANGHRSGYQYAVARFTRLYSIFFPAILVTIICALLINFINSEIYDNYDRGNNFIRYILSLLFLNELWFLSSAPLINGPIWSLGYEFWYYALFGVCIYRLNGWKGWLLPVGVAVFAGPKILLMMLIWIMGWAAYYIRRPRTTGVSSWVAIVVLLIFAIALMIFLPPMPFEINSIPLFWGAQFVTDWIVGFFIALAIWLLPSGDEKKTSSSDKLKSVRIIANMTFPIYVLHFPVLVLLKCLLPLSLTRETQWMIGGSIALVICILLGLLFEANKDKWKYFFQWAFKRLQDKNLNTAG